MLGWILKTVTNLRDGITQVFGLIVVDLLFYCLIIFSPYKGSHTIHLVLLTFLNRYIVLTISQDLPQHIHTVVIETALFSRHISYINKSWLFLQQAPAILSMLNCLLDRLPGLHLQHGSTNKVITWPAYLSVCADDRNGY